jgi:hypothetical protein
MKTYEVLINKFLRWYRCTWYYTYTNSQKFNFLANLVGVAGLGYVVVMLINIIMLRG